MYISTGVFLLWREMDWVNALGPKRVVQHLKTTSELCLETQQSQKNIVPRYRFNGWWPELAVSIPSLQLIQVLDLFGRVGLQPEGRQPEGPTYIALIVNTLAVHHINVVYWAGMSL